MRFKDFPDFRGKVGQNHTLIFMLEMLQFFVIYGSFRVKSTDPQSCLLGAFCGFLPFALFNEILMKNFGDFVLGFWSFVGFGRMHLVKIRFSRDKHLRRRKNAPDSTRPSSRIGTACVETITVMVSSGLVKQFLKFQYKLTFYPFFLAEMFFCTHESESFRFK